MNAARLLTLADRLDAVDPKQFDLSGWFLTPPFKDKSEPCGTVACAVGHACLMPEFNAAGLTRDTGDDPYYSGCPVYARPDGQAVRAWGAVVEFFDLNMSQADYLFLDAAYPGGALTPPAGVAGRIRDVVANGFPPL